MANVLLAPGAVRVKFALDPVYINLASLYMLNFADTCPDVDKWVKQTAADLSAQQMRNQLVVLEILYSAFEPDEAWPSFPAYLNGLAERDPYLMRNRFLRHMFPDIGEDCVYRNQLMDPKTFVSQIDQSEFDREFEQDLFAEAYALLDDPPAMHDRIVSHLTTMWHEVLAPEWEHNEAFLQQVVDAFQKRDHSGLTAYEAIRVVTDREAHGSWQNMLAATQTLIFIPSPHIGPYLMHFAYAPVVRMMFDAHLPQEVVRGPAELSRNDLLIQLRALADETRLRILELLLERGEMCAQEIIVHLKLTSSSASRHLSQLSATGYLTESQGQGKNKWYGLNPERFRKILRLLEQYARA